MASTIIYAGVFVAGVVSGTTGLAFPLIAGPILLLEHAPSQAVILTSSCSLLGQILSFCLLGRTISYDIRWNMILAGLVGVPLGTQLLVSADPTVMRYGFGVLLILSSLPFFAGPRLRIARHAPIIDTLVGWAGGICGGLFGVSAAVPTLWFCLQGLERDRHRAVMQPFIVAIQAASIASIWLRGNAGTNTVSELGLYIVPVLLGVAVGTELFRRASSKLYFHAVVLITLCSGIALIGFH